MSETAKTSEPIITVRDLVNKFGDHLVHDHLDFEVKRGEIMGLVGGSGSGKSVLLNSIIGLHHPNEGTIELAGDAKRDIGVLFQHGALFSGLTVEENIMVPLKEHTKLSDQDLRALARMKLRLVGLAEEAATKYPSELSGGMIKRASLARALALDPALLCLDEPTAGLDPIAADDFDKLILELQQGTGMTIVMVTHDLDSLFELCDRIAVLVDKKIIIDTLEGHQASEHPWIKNYFHGPRARNAQSAGAHQGQDAHGT